MTPSKQFSMRGDEQMWRHMDALCQHYGITISNIIRMLLKREYDRLREDGKIK
jgi:antitoxin component of RelBE/YafQ-DinJ toxin-antitoxin module